MGQMIGIFLVLGFESCSGEDRSVCGDDFKMRANTIQFTAYATGERKSVTRRLLMIRDGISLGEQGTD